MVRAVRLVALGGLIALCLAEALAALAAMSEDGGAPYSRQTLVLVPLALAASCERVDMVAADRRLPTSCRPYWLKLDCAMLSRTGSMTIDLKQGKNRTVVEGQRVHGRWPAPTPRKPRQEAAQPAQL